MHIYTNDKVVYVLIKVYIYIVCISHLHSPHLQDAAPQVPLVPPPTWPLLRSPPFLGPQGPFPQEMCGKIMNQWIGLRENLQETMVFTIKHRGFRLKFSHHPIL